MIQAVAFYGWGVGRIASDASQCWGMVYSSRTRDRNFGILTENLKESRMRYLSILPVLGLNIGNYEEGVQLRDQCNGLGRTTFSGT